MLLRIALVVTLQATAVLAVAARDLAPELGVLLENFQAHRRVAIGYLRTQNPELGATEIERLRDRWAADRLKLAVADPALEAALARTEELVAEAMKAVDSGDVERSGRLLQAAAAPLNDWRKANGIRLFSDCIAEITAAYRPLDLYRQENPDLTNRSLAGRILALTDSLNVTLRRCDREAPEAVRGEQEFRRLLDGMRNSLRQMPDAVGARDGAWLHRLLIEQRAFERLLLFRFG
jgi:hypothetical protein